MKATPLKAIERAHCPLCHAPADIQLTIEGKVEELCPNSKCSNSPYFSGPRSKKIEDTRQEKMI